MERSITKEVISLEELLNVDTGSRLIVHNDEVNTFDWVIQSLIEICRHSEEQAEQCAYLIHFKGKYAVKSGSFHELKPMKDALVDRTISATIEDNQ